MNRFDLLTEATNLLVNYTHSLNRAEKEGFLSKGLAYSLAEQTQEVAKALQNLVNLEVNYSEY